MAGRLSGGQQRLLALALELLNDRRILFLDEPTSGLDSPASLELVTILRRLSKKVNISRICLRVVEVKTCRRRDTRS